MTANASLLWPSPNPSSAAILQVLCHSLCRDRYHRVEPIQHLLRDLVGEFVPHLEDQTVNHLLAPLAAIHQLSRDDIDQCNTLVRSRKSSAQAILQDLLKDTVALIRPGVRNDTDHRNNLTRTNRSDVARKSAGSERIVVEDEVVSRSTIGTMEDRLPMSSWIVASITFDIRAHCCRSDDERAFVN